MAAKKKPAHRGHGGGLRNVDLAGELIGPEGTKRAPRPASLFALIGPDLVVIAVAASRSALEARG